MKEKSGSLLNPAAARLLSLGFHLLQGRDHAMLSYSSQAKMAMRLGPFGVKDRSRATSSIDRLTTETSSAYLYAAWGLFSWVRCVSQASPTGHGISVLERLGGGHSSV